MNIPGIASLSTVIVSQLHKSHGIQSSGQRRVDRREFTLSKLVQLHHSNEGDTMAKKGSPAAKAAARKAAATRAENKLKKQIADAPAPDLSKYEALGNTPEERKAAARKAKIAEIKKREKSESDAKAAKRSKAGKKAAKTRKSIKAFKQEGELRLLLKQIRKADDDEAVKLLRDYYMDR